MASAAKQILDGLVEFLNDELRGYSEKFTARRAVSPNFDKQKLNTLKVSVFSGPRRMSADLGTRETPMAQYTCFVAFQRWVDAKSEAEELAEVDRLDALVEEVERSLYLQDIGESQFLGIDENAAERLPYFAELMMQENVFTTVVGVDYLKALLDVC